MVDAVIVLIILVLLFFALKGSVKHFKGEGSCCSGGSSSLLKTGEKHLDGPVVAERVIHISGMHCQNCSERVKRALDSIDGVSASVNLEDGSAYIKMDRSIDDVQLKKKVDEAGYTVLSISQK